MRKFRLVVAGMTLALCAIVATTALAQPHTRAAGPFQIALSNSFIGNKWRIEMENDFKAACKMEPYKTAGPVLGLQLGQRRREADAADLEPDLSGRRRDRHRRRVADRPERHHRAGLRAWHRRRLVRQHRHRRRARIKVNTDQFTFGAAGRAVHRRPAAGQGQRDHGDRRRRHVRPTPTATRAPIGWSRSTRASRSSPSYTGMWDSSTAQRNTAAAAAVAADRSTASGVSGGTDGVLKAFIAAGRPLPGRPPARARTATGHASSVGYHGAATYGISLGQPPFLVVASLELAREVLRSPTHAEEERHAALPGSHREDGEARRDRLPETCRTASSRTSPTRARTPS